MRTNLETSQRKFGGANPVCDFEESERALRRQSDIDQSSLWNLPSPFPRDDKILKLGTEMKSYCLTFILAIVTGEKKIEQTRGGERAEKKTKEAKKDALIQRNVLDNPSGIPSM
jgi:hypothetical protein